MDGNIWLHIVSLHHSLFICFLCAASKMSRLRMITRAIETCSTTYLNVLPNECQTNFFVLWHSNSNLDGSVTHVNFKTHIPHHKYIDVLFPQKKYIDVLYKMLLFSLLLCDVQIFSYNWIFSYYSHKIYGHSNARFYVLVVIHIIIHPILLAISSTFFTFSRSLLVIVFALKYLYS